MLNQSEINKILIERIDTHQQSVGIVIGTISNQQTTVVSHGHLDTTQKLSVDSATIFEIGSITKVFTTLLLTEMVANGQVDFDDPVQKYLPEHVQLSVNATPITLIQLATHMSGLPEFVDPIDPTNPHADPTVDHLYEFLNTYVPERAPDELWEYSSLGMGLLGHVLEGVSSKSYEQLILEHICKPLDMQSTFVNVPHKLLEHKSTGHNDSLNPVLDLHLVTEAGSGALRSTIDDLLKFLSFNMGHSSSLYSSAEKTHQVYKDGLNGAAAIGWDIVQSKAGNDILWHDGRTNGFTSFIAFDKTLQEGVIVLSNSENMVVDLGVHIQFPNNPLDRFDFKEISLPPVILNEYVGDYEISPELILSVFVKNGCIFTQATGQEVVEIFPETETFFFVKEFQAQITFQKNEKGNVTGLILHQNGDNTLSPKK